MKVTKIHFVAFSLRRDFRGLYDGEHAEAFHLFYCTARENVALATFLEILFASL